MQQQGEFSVVFNRRVALGLLGIKVVTVGAMLIVLHFTSLKQTSNPESPP